VYSYVDDYIIHDFCLVNGLARHEQVWTAVWGCLYVFIPVLNITFVHNLKNNYCVLQVLKL